MEERRAIVSGSGHEYLFLFVESLEDLSENFHDHSGFPGA